MTEYTIQQIMEHLPDAFVAEKAEGVNAVIQCRFTGAEASDWLLTIKDAKCSTESGTNPKAQLTLTMNSQDFKDMITGKLNAMTAFMQGKIKLNGDIALAMKFTNLFQAP
jgi:putative sterol carrier protein